MPGITIAAIRPFQGALMSEKKDSAPAPESPKPAQGAKDTQPVVPEQKKTEPVPEKKPDTPQSANASSPAQQPIFGEGGKTAASTANHQKASEPIVTLAKTPEAAADASPDEAAHIKPAEVVDDEETADAPETQKTPAFSSAWGNFFNGCAKVGPLILLIALCLMLWPEFFPANQAMYCPPEGKYISAFLRSSTLDAWLAPIGLENGRWTAMQWPFYYWYLGALGAIPGVAGSGLLLQAATALAGALAILAVWFLAAAARFGTRAALAAGIVVLCSPLLGPLPHFTGPITLSAAMVLFALGFFCLGWRAESAWFSLPAAFVFSALAALCGGPVFFAVPLLACVLYLFWALRWKRAQALDALSGFIIMLLILGWWLGTIMWGDYPQSYLATLFEESIKFSWPPAQFWWLALAGGLLGVLPWLLMVFGVSWLRVFARAGQTLGASRRDNGSAIVWLSFIVVACLGVFTPGQHSLAVLTGCLAAVLLGKAFVNLSPLGNRFFFLLASLLLFVIGIVILGMGFEFSATRITSVIAPLLPMVKIPAWTPALRSLPIIGGIMIVGGMFGFFFVKQSRQCGGMIYALLLAIVLCQVFSLMFAPEVGRHEEARLRTLASIEEVVAQELRTPSSVVPAETPDVPAATETNATKTQAGNGDPASGESAKSADNEQASETQADSNAGESAADGETPPAIPENTGAQAPEENNAPKGVVEPESLAKQIPPKITGADKAEE